jgi:hypothetical protein
LPATYEVIHAISWGSERRDHASPDLPRESFIAPSTIRRRGQT